MMLSVHEDTPFVTQVFGGTSRSFWTLPATSVSSAFTGFEAAELKVIVAK